MDTKPKRRWHQFSLRTFFVLVTLVCIGFGYWVHWARDWIRQRHEMFEMNMISDKSPTGGRPLAPAGLWLFGEEGVSSLMMVPGEPGIDSGPRRDRAQQLFPEAKFTKYVRPQPKTSVFDFNK
jgi:hypothetical protein